MCIVRRYVAFIVLCDVEAALMFCLNDDRVFAEATVNEDGRGKVCFRRVPPRPAPLSSDLHQLTLKECDTPADVACE